MRLPAAGRRRDTYTVTAAKRRHEVERNKHELTSQNIRSMSRMELEYEEIKQQHATLDLFELVARAQSNRLDDQRCSLPSYFATQNRRSSNGESSSSSATSSPPAVSGSQRALENVLRGAGPYPSVLLPPGGGYWQEEAGTQPPAAVPELEIDDTATAYRTHFMGKEHCNLVCEEAGLMSVRTEPTEDGGESTRILLRMRSGTTHRVVTAQTHMTHTPAQLARLASPELQLGDEARFTPVLCPRAAELIAAYDEHAVARTFKFGVLQQRRGQTTEEQIFSNRAPSPALLHFLSHLGDTVKLAHHKGYRGGLDTQFGQTGEESVFSVFRERELMFHVAPMLPYTENDPQQLQRKRHIGNDIVALVFQEENTPFAPDMIASHFLHVFLVVQPVSPPPHVRYRVTVAAREGVPSFGPPLPPSSEFAAGPELREWLLTKLVNAEAAACKARKFASLEERTRASLLVSLTEELRSRTSRFLGDSSSAPASPEQRQQQHGAGSRFISTVRKAISARARAPQPPQQLQTQTSKSLVTAVPESPARLHCEVSRRSSADSGSSERPSQTGNGSGSSTPDLPPAHRTTRDCVGMGNGAESDASSVGSGTEETERSQRLHLHHYAGDSDTGLESMSSADTARCCSLEPAPPCITAAEAEALTQEVARLKCDKLDLLRHNVICQRDVKILTEETLQLRAELSAASSELRRLRALLRECAFSSDASDV